MATGIAISDKCTDAFALLSKRTYGAIILKINNENTEITLEKIIEPASNSPEDEWKAVVEALPKDDCRYILTDFKWRETATVTKSKLILILWSKENSPIRNKMIYASSAEAVTTKMTVQRTIQATEMDEVRYAEILKKLT